MDMPSFSLIIVWCSIRSFQFFIILNAVPVKICGWNLCASISLIVSLGEILRILRFESCSVLTFKLLFKMVTLLCTHRNNV